MLIPSVLDLSPSIINYFPYPVKLYGGKSVRVRKLDLGFQPELRQISVLSYVNMNWLSRIAFVRVKEESEAVQDENDGHSRLIDCDD